MRVWITKYALTKGIYETNAEIVDDIYASGKTAKFAFFTREWARSADAARIVADDMRRKKIASLKKQIARLEGMEF